MITLAGRKPKDYTGQRFGKWRAISRDHGHYWLCLDNDGNESVKDIQDLWHQRRNTEAAEWVSEHTPPEPEPVWCNYVYFREWRKKLKRVNIAVITEWIKIFLEPIEAETIQDCVSTTQIVAVLKSTFPKVQWSDGNLATLRKTMLDLGFTEFGEEHVWQANPNSKFFNGEEPRF